MANFRYELRREAQRNLKKNPGRLEYSFENGAGPTVTRSGV